MRSRGIKPKSKSNGTDSRQMSHPQITTIQEKINRKPKEKLNFSTPIECFHKKIS
jgi:IS30 family transposase